MNPLVTGAEAVGRVPNPDLAERAPTPPDTPIRSRTERCACGMMLTATTDPASWQPVLDYHYRTVEHVRWRAREADL